MVEFTAYDLILTISIAMIVGQSEGILFLHNYPKVRQHPVMEVSTEPLFLTPYIKEGKILEGQKAASVIPLLGNVTSYSGFFTVNEKLNSNMFFWFFLSETDWENAPLLMWLQGGPGASSLMGLFEENGPYDVVGDKNELRLREYRWTKSCNVLYVDNPVGTGFSFTQSELGYIRNQEHLARDLYVMLTQFFQLFPTLSKNEFYLTGESYAGKYIPSLGYAIHRKNRKANIKMKINLKGLLIGNGLIDPVNMISYGDYLYQLGLVDDSSLRYLHEEEELVKVLIRSKNYKSALNPLRRIFNFIQQVGFATLFDFTNTNSSLPIRTFDFVQQHYVRNAIHVGSFVFHDLNVVFNRLEHDFMQSVVHLLPELLDSYKVMLYNGQFDIIVAYPLTVNFLKHLSWKGAADYHKATRKLWYVDGQVAGYWKTAGNLTEMLVRNAGHNVPTYQPKWAYKMLTTFLKAAFV